VCRFEIDLHFGMAVVEAVQLQAEFLDEWDVQGELHRDLRPAPGRSQAAGPPLGGPERSELGAVNLRALVHG
jgi:hypothetical protein